jgi:hypothetical protein
MEATALATAVITETTGRQPQVPLGSHDGGRRGMNDMVANLREPVVELDPVTRT